MYYSYILGRAIDCHHLPSRLGMSNLNRVWRVKDLSPKELKLHDSIQFRWVIWHGITSEGGVHLCMLDYEHLLLELGLNRKQLDNLIVSLEQKGLLIWVGLCEQKIFHDPPYPHHWEQRVALFHDNRITRRFMQSCRPASKYQILEKTILPKLKECLVSNQPNQEIPKPPDPPKVKPSILPNKNCGFVYLLKGIHGFYKIGKAKEPVQRIRRLEVVLPFPIEVEHLIECRDYNIAEVKLHRRYSEQRKNGEWFELSPEQVEEIKAIMKM